MTLVRRLALPLLLAIVIPTSGVAASEPTVKLRPKAPAVVTETSQMTARVNLHGRFSSLTMVCFTITFGGDTQVGDLLDPGEAFLIWSETGWGFGRLNLDAGPRAVDTVCTVQPEVLELFLDGKETVMIAMEGLGHVRITDVSVTAS